MLTRARSRRKMPVIHNKLTLSSLLLIEGVFAVSAFAKTRGMIQLLGGGLRRDCGRKRLIGFVQHERG